MTTCCSKLSVGTVAVVAMVALLAGSAEAFFETIVSADSGTFDKIVTPESTTIVRFEIKNSHGDRWMAWKKFAEWVGEIGLSKLDVLPVEVNVHHHKFHNDDYTNSQDFNQDLARRFNVSYNVDNYDKFAAPVFLMRKGAANFKKPIKWVEHDQTSEDNLKRFLQKHVADSYLGLSGTSLVLDRYARKFLSAGGSGDTAKAIEAREEYVDELLAEIEALKEGRKRTVTKKMKRLGLAGPLTVDLNEEETEEHFEKESTAFRETPSRREDLEYYVTVMALIQEFGSNAAIDEKRRLSEELAEIVKSNKKDATGPPSVPNRAPPKKRTPVTARAAALRKKAFTAPNRVLKERLETWLNILSTFRSPGAVNASNQAELDLIKEEKMEAFAKRRKALTGRTTPPLSVLRKQREAREKAEAAASADGVVVSDDNDDVDEDNVAGEAFAAADHGDASSSSVPASELPSSPSSASPDQDEL